MARHAACLRNRAAEAAANLDFTHILHDPFSSLCFIHAVPRVCGPATAAHLTLSSWTSSRSETPVGAVSLDRCVPDSRAGGWGMLARRRIAIRAGTLTVYVCVCGTVVASSGTADRTVCEDRSWDFCCWAIGTRVSTRYRLSPVLSSQAQATPRAIQAEAPRGRGCDRIRSGRDAVSTACHRQAGWRCCRRARCACR